MDIKEIIYNLELAGTVIPNYAKGRSRGLTDSETERLVILSIYKASQVLEQQVQEQEDISIDDTCDNFCNLIDDFKDLVDQLQMEIEMLRKNRS